MQVFGVTERPEGTESGTLGKWTYFRFCEVVKEEFSEGGGMEGEDVARVLEISGVRSGWNCWNSTPFLIVSLSFDFVGHDFGERDE